MRTTSSIKQFLITGLAVAVLGVATSAQAQITPIGSPDAAYLGSTTLIPITAPDFAVVASITDGTETVSFTPSMQAGTVPGGGWGTWDSPPDSETATPRVLHAVGYDPSVTMLEMLLSAPADIFGFEAEPDPFSVHSMTADFYNGATLLGSITRSVDGFAGSRLFAASTTSQITRVVFSSDADFGVAQVRYHLGTTAVPEPGSIAFLLGTGLAGVGFFIRRRR